MVKLFESFPQQSLMLFTVDSRAQKESDNTRA